MQWTMKLLGLLTLCFCLVTAETGQCGQYFNNSEVPLLLSKAQLEIPSSVVVGNEGDDDKCCTCVKTFVDRILGYMRDYVKKNYCAKLPAAQQAACNKCIDTNKTIEGFFIGHSRLFAQGANYCIGKGDCPANMTLTSTIVNSQDRLALFKGNSVQTWEKHPDVYLSEYASPSGIRIAFDTLQPALDECDAMGEAKCTGVTLNNGHFELRRGKVRNETILIKSPYGETSWLRGNSNSVVYYALAQMMIGTMITVKLPNSAPNFHVEPSHASISNVHDSQVDFPRMSSRFINIRWAIDRITRHHGKPCCTACKAWVNTHVVMSGLKSWKAYCQSTKCPFYQAVCKWGDTNPQELLGYVIAFVEPWKYSDSYCYGKGVCPHPTEV